MQKIFRLLALTTLLSVGLFSCERDDDGSVDGWVDLGLPSGLLWANCNLGADSPEEYGNYYAWGEVAPKENYSQRAYVHSYGEAHGYTKYCYSASHGYDGFTDTLTLLTPSDDAATMLLGDGARMPTKEEWEELLNECDSRWDTQNGVKGRRFTGPNGNRLFLPAAGERWDDTLTYRNSVGRYWSASLWMDYPNRAWALDFDFLSRHMYYYPREIGLSVRAVREAR